MRHSSVNIVCAKWLPYQDHLLLQAQDAVSGNEEPAPVNPAHPERTAEQQAQVYIRLDHPSVFHLMEICVSVLPFILCFNLSSGNS